jgi:FkbM family methyltransferase
MEEHRMGDDARGLVTRAAAGVAGAVPASWFHPITAWMNRRAEPEMKRLVAACDPMGMAVDVGAWYGPWTYWLSRRVREVVAFEPNPAVAAALRAGARPNVTVREAAVSDASGSAELVIRTPGLGSEGTATIVPGTAGPERVGVETVRLDDLDLRDVRFVKIDVEGHEAAVLDGAERLLAEQHPVLFIELDARMADISHTFDRLLGLGYSGRVMAQGEWRPIGSSDLAARQREFAETHPEQSYLQSVIRPAGFLNDVAFVHPAGTWSPW